MELVVQCLESEGSKEKMEKSGKQEKGNKKLTEVKTFTVPFALPKRKENLIINSNTPSKPSKEEIINQAINFHIQGKISEAATSYQYCINQGFIDPRVFANYGSILKDLGKLEEAELSTRKAIEINPSFAKTHYNLGNILKDRGKLEEAELSTRKAIEINPDFRPAHLNLGNILKDLGKLKEAELSTRKAIKIQANFADGHCNLGAILKNLGKLEEAELSTRKAIELDPNYAKAHSNLGIILSELGKSEEAINHWKKAVELKPEVEESVLLLAQHLCYEQKYELALKYLINNKSNSCQSVFLGCLLSLDREKDFNRK